MIDFLTVCEGHSERDFCNRVLRPYLYPRGIEFAGKLVGKPDRKLPGIGPSLRYEADLKRIINESHQRPRYIGILVDYFRMPTSWPGRAAAPTLPTAERGQYVEDQLRSNAEPSYQDRFVPCVQLHEFETLLFCDPDRTSLSISVDSGNFDEPAIAKLTEEMKAIVASCDDKVEYINDRQDKTPSARIEQLFPGYNKPVQGVNALMECEISDLRKKCPWLHRWLNAIEGLVAV